MSHISMQRLLKLLMTRELVTLTMRCDHFRQFCEFKAQFGHCASRAKQKHAANPKLLGSVVWVCDDVQVQKSEDEKPLFVDGAEKYTLYTVVHTVCYILYTVY